MKHIYLIGNGSRAAQYGVGTYIRQMFEFFRQTSSVRLTIVELNSEVKEVTEECDNSGKVRYLKIPAQKSEGRKGDVAYCYRNIAYLLALHFLKDEQNVLHLNYLHQDPYQIYRMHCYEVRSSCLIYGCWFHQSKLLRITLSEHIL